MSRQLHIRALKRFALVGVIAAAAFPATAQADDPIVGEWVAGDGTRFAIEQTSGPGGLPFQMRLLAAGPSSVRVRLGCKHPLGSRISHFATSTGGPRSLHALVEPNSNPRQAWPVGLPSGRRYVGRGFWMRPVGDACEHAGPMTMSVLITVSGSRMDYCRSWREGVSVEDPPTIRIECLTFTRPPARPVPTPVVPSVPRAVPVPSGRAVPPPVEIPRGVETPPRGLLATLQEPAGFVLRVSGNAVQVTLRCPGRPVDFCAGSLSLLARGGSRPGRELATATFSGMRGGESRSVSLPLSDAGRTYVRAEANPRLAVSVEVRSGAERASTNGTIQR